MSSPFPGLDPYLEFSGLWPDFHARFNNALCEALTAELPNAYDARIGERYNLVEVEPAEKQHRIEPDVAVTKMQTSRSATAAATESVALLEPVIIPLLIEDETRQTYIEIFHRPERKLVAVVELLSPANKQGSGRTLDLAKRQSLIYQDVHVIELDLLLGGGRLPMQRALPPGDYYALVSRSDRRPDSDVYAWTVRNPLPVVPIPLLSPDPDVMIKLAEVYATTWERGRYEAAMDYTVEPPAANLDTDAATLAWIKQQTGRIVDR